MNFIEEDNLCKSFNQYNLIDIPNNYIHLAKIREIHQTKGEIDPWVESLIEEIKTLDEKDPDIKEAYSNFNLKLRKAYVEYLAKIGEIHQALGESEIDTWVESLIEEIKTREKKDLIILLNVEETGDSDSMTYWCNSLTKHLSKTSLNYVILTNSTFKYADDYDRVISVNWFLHSTVSVYTKDNIENLPWESTNSSVLFLPGKPWKPMRLPALYYFLRSSLRYNLKYSSITFEEMIRWSDTGADETRRILESWNLVYGTPPGILNQTKSYSINEIRTIMNRLAKVLDKNGFKGRDYYMLCPTMYSDVGVEIVSETEPTNEEFVTEKTYKPIVLGYPFVYIHSNFIDQIISQGFKVYQPMVPMEDRFSRDWKSEFETCVENTEKVLNNMKGEYIESAIKYNQQHAMDLHQETINNIAKIILGFEKYAEEIFSRHVDLQRENHA